MLTYTQIEAICEAMRECENERCEYCDRDACPAAHYEVDDVSRCFAKIRAALAGVARCAHCPSPADGPHKMSCAVGKDRDALAGSLEEKV